MASSLSHGRKITYPENPNIAEGLYMAGDIETWGLSFDKIKRACEQYGTPLPEITVTKGTVKILVKPAESYMRVLSSVVQSPVKPSVKSSVKSEDYPKKLSKRCVQILNFMQDNTPYSSTEIGEVLGLKESRTRELLRELVKSGYITSTTDAAKGRRYIKG